MVKILLLFLVDEALGSKLGLDFVTHSLRIGNDYFEYFIQELAGFLAPSAVSSQHTKPLTPRKRLFNLTVSWKKEILYKIHTSRQINYVGYKSVL